MYHFELGTLAGSATTQSQVPTIGVDRWKIPVPTFLPLTGLQQLRLLAGRLEFVGLRLTCSYQTSPCSFPNMNPSPPGDRRSKFS
jgi:hypothetical protein